MKATSSIIYCYNDKTGEFIKEYSTVDLFRVYGKNKQANILNACKYGFRSYGYYWSREKYKNIIKSCDLKPQSKSAGTIKLEDVIPQKNIKQNINDKSIIALETNTVNKSFQDKLTEQIAERYSIEELKILAKGNRIETEAKTPFINVHGQHIKLGVLGDTHLGSSYTDPNDLYLAFDIYKKEKVDFICHTGDVTEGMSHRPGHVYELDYIGYAKQKDHAIKVFSEIPAPIYMIDGNHDRWYIKSNGALVVKDICDAIPQAYYLGHDEGDIELPGGIKIRLWHGEDGNSYATSYRIQKVVESLSGGEKPNVMFLGHTHKYAYIFERNIHCLSAGCIQRQTPWMRGKRISAHTGFSIVDIWINERGIVRFRPEWFPFYK